MKLKLRQIFTLVLLGLGVYVIFPQLSTLENSWNVLLSLTLWAVFLACIVEILAYMSNGYLMQQILEHTHQHVPLLHSTLIVLGSLSVGFVAGGTVGSSAAIFHWTKQKEGNIRGPFLASFLLSMSNNLMLLWLSILGIIHLIIIRDLNRTEVIGYSASMTCMVTLVAGTVLAGRYRDRSVDFLNWLAKQLGRLRLHNYDQDLTRTELTNIFLAWDSLWQDKKYKLVLGAFFYVVFDMSALFFLFLAAGVKITLGMLLSGYALPLLLGKIAFILPGGVGIVETSMIAIFSGMGVPPATAVIVVLVFRLLTFWIPTIIGFPIAAYLVNHNGIKPPVDTEQNSII
jgi:glycosyltransferase 2 family protein